MCFIYFYPYYGCHLAEPIKCYNFSNPTHSTPPHRRDKHHMVERIPTQAHMSCTLDHCIRGAVIYFNKLDFSMSDAHTVLTSSNESSNTQLLVRSTLLSSHNELDARRGEPRTTPTSPAAPEGHFMQASVPDLKLFLIGDL